MEFLYVIALLTTGVWSEQIHVIGRTNGEKISFDISLEEDFMIALTARQPDPPLPGYTQSINLYDFEKHLEARKLSDVDTCYIRPFLATYEQTRVILENVTLSASKETDHVTLDWNIGEEILVDQLGELVGERIADFCAGSRVVLASVTLQESVLKDEAIEASGQDQQQGYEQITAANKVKRSSNHGSSVPLLEQIEFENGRFTGSAEAHRRWNAVLDVLARAQYRWENGNIGGSVGYNSLDGYHAAGSLNIHRNNWNLNGGLSYNQRSGLSAGLEFSIVF